ncbi:coiled-coil domain-containing protein 103 [Brienomyrus brachyistius]|uniref:coiled-coil domain-containing protein 103 n=1 Tax=Brienomyrus brachyistius TaxID=42636 RepID=UPI0020B30203|nr:coiled-coil domain-containing protein 103 [Brienomyrus brachyistius]XP_048848210.1 coiled-coil domain-containing protein 103 [Brienomyrus brachyistius]
MDGPEVINFASVESALNAALESDERYQRENNAKFRAVRQRVASYEEFRDIVLASHLKPLEKSDVVGAPRKQPWNCVFSATKQKDMVCCEVTECEAAKFQPQTASEFQRDWRRLGGNVKDKYHCIISLGGPKLREIFKIEIGAGLLGEFLIIMAECMQAGDGAGILAILQGLSQTCRFSLNVSLLDQAEREGCSQLFGRLLDIMDKQALKGHTRVGHDSAHEHTTETRGTEKNDQGFCDAQAAGEGIDVEKLKDLMQCYDVKTQPFTTRLHCITQDS